MKSLYCSYQAGDRIRSFAVGLETETDGHNSRRASVLSPWLGSSGPNPCSTAMHDVASDYEEKPVVPELSA